MNRSCSHKCVQDQMDVEAVVAGEARLTFDQAMLLYREASLHDLGRWASAVCDRVHGTQVRTFVKDRNINYTNVCSARCTFCAFRRDNGASDAYTLSREQLHQKVRELVEAGGTQVLLQGGMHPDLPIAFYEDLLGDLKATFPHIHIHGFSPPEVVEFVAVFAMDGFPTTLPGQSHTLPADVWQAKLDAILTRLKTAGLDSIPGGGGEIFASHVRRRIGLGKATAPQWLDVMAGAHRQGMQTSATMMFGHIEGLADRIDHMDRIRKHQDQAIAHGWPGRYVSFISWPFQRENTPLGRLPDWDAAPPFAGDVLAEAVSHQRVKGDDADACRAFSSQAGKQVRLAGATDYLRTQAISRLYLDNIHSIGASWVTMGPRIGQLGLFYGANDMGSIMMEENVVSAAGTTYCLDEPVLCHLIRSSGFTPAQRDNQYNQIKVYDSDDSPDLLVTDWSQHRAVALKQQSPGAEKTVPLTTPQGSETV